MTGPQHSAICDDDTRWLLDDSRTLMKALGGLEHFQQTEDDMRFGLLIQLATRMGVMADFSDPPPTHFTGKSQGRDFATMNAHTEDEAEYPTKRARLTLPENMHKDC